MFNYSNLTIPKIFGECQIGFNEYDAACVYNHYCGQFSGYVINTGIAIVIIYLLSGWVLWWFLQHGYKHIDWEEINKNKTALHLLGGDMRDADTRQYWDTQIRDLVTKLAVGFIAVVVYLSLWKK